MEIAAMNATMNPHASSMRSSSSRRGASGARLHRACAPVRRQAAQRGSTSSRTSAVRVLAFQTQSRTALEAAASFPSPLLASSADLQDPQACTLSSSSFELRGSWWYSAINEQNGIVEGAEAFRAACDRWKSQNSSNTIFSFSACVGSDAFVLFITKVDPAGPYVIQPPSCLVHGVYRLHFDEQEQVQKAWCFRSPTTHESKQLLVSSLVSSSLHGSPGEIAAVAAATKQGPKLLPCTWAVDEAYTQLITAYALSWIEEVQSKASLQSMFLLADPDLQCYPGTRLYCPGPPQSLTDLAERLTAESRCTQMLGARQVLASASRENVVFVHWQQQAARRSRAHASSSYTLEGMSVMVFGEDGKVFQVLDYGTPTEHDGAKPASEEQGQPVAPAAAASPQVPRALTQEEADAIARQENEWSAW